MMGFLLRLLTMCLLFLAESKFASASRILAVFPVPMASHTTLLQTVTIELAKRGHELVVFTGSSAGKKISELPNYQEIFLEDNAKYIPPSMGTKWKDQNFLVLLWNLQKILETIGEATFEHPEMKRMISRNNKENFDLIIIEYYHWTALTALGYRFNAPVVGILSISLNIISAGEIDLGLPFNLIDRPNYMDGNEGDKTFIQRLTDLAMEVGKSIIQYNSLYGQQKMVEKSFGKDYPHVHDLMKNVSMIFGTQDDVMPYPTIGLPNIVNIGGIHVNKDFDQALPRKIKDFMEGGKDGVIYFSLGSTVKGIEIPEKVRNIFLETFSELPYRVLWKWENDTLPGKPENVFISKWMPQRAILAHPSIKLYIYQGGLQSTEEAMLAGVPFVGIPLFGDQPWNVNKMVSVGAAIKLEINDITKAKLKAAILEVIHNEKYKKNIIKFRDLVNDRPYDPIENTMWWIEYVIRHKGAHHLRIARANLPWYQANHIDTLGFMFTVILLTIFVFYKIMKVTICRYSIRQKKNISGQKAKLS